jgi:hypothetical protein
MSNENEADILDSLDSLAKLAGLIRIVIGGAIVIGTVLVGVAGWVWTINAATSSHGAQLEKIGPSVRTLETWRATYDVEKYTAREAASLDKRLQRVEDQNAAIMEALKRIDSKLP